MELCGTSVLVNGVSMKPGMACAHGFRKGKPVFAFSGNPVSAAVNLLTVAAPALRRYCGRSTPLSEEIPVTLLQPYPKASPCCRILYGKLDLSNGTTGFQMPVKQGNIMASQLQGCNVLAFVPAGSGPLSQGTLLKGILF